MFTFRTDKIQRFQLLSPKRAGSQPTSIGCCPPFDGHDWHLAQVEWQFWGHAGGALQLNGDDFLEMKLHTIQV